MDLKATYDKIDLQNREPKAQPDALRADLYTRALWTLGAWSSDLAGLFADLGPLRQRGILFDNKPARLHWSLLQFQTFPINPNQTTYNDPGLVCKIRAVLDRYPPLHIVFRGIARTRFGLFLCGYPTFNVNQMRNELRALCPDELNEPHPQDICHSTLFRFTEDPSPDDIALLDMIVAKYHDLELCKMHVDKWEFGYGTWTQKDGERIVAAEWSAKPPRWILHRGLMNGPDPEKENKEELLWKRLAEGWDIEVDVWLVDGSLWLGHDKPTDLLQDVRLLESHHTWIHCKNIPMLQYMTEKKPGGPFFSHDTDNAVLTSNGYIWCYPGFQAGRQSIVVMPERVPDMKVDMALIGGVCSDYTTHNNYI
jgi:hypothetical protein